MLTVKSISSQTKTRAYGRLSDGTGFEVIKHLGSGRFEIRHLDQGQGRGKVGHSILTPAQRLVIRCHPVSVAIRAADINSGREGGEE